ncbi:MAG: hypothetical protein U0P81_08820 [Holophagaceae bacterium]
MSAFRPTISLAMVGVHACVLSLGAQVPLPGPQQFWGNDAASLVTARDGDSGYTIELAMWGQKPKRIDLAGKKHFCWWENGTSYAFSMEKVKNRYYFWSSKDFVTWDLIGSCSGDVGKIFRFCPLENGDLFLTSAIQPFQKDGQASFFATARVEPSTNELQIRELVGPDSKKLFHVLPKKPGEASSRLELKPQAEEFVGLSLADILPTGKYLAIPFSKYGLLYLFNRTTGRQERIVSIFNTIGETQALNSRMSVEAIIGIQTRPDGSLTLVTRSEDAVLTSSKIHPETRWGSDQSFDQFRAVADSMEEKSLKAFPDLFYWRFDPETTEVTRVSVPKGFPAAVQDLKEFHKVILRYGLNGELRPVIVEPSSVRTRKKESRKS